MLIQHGFNVDSDNDVDKIAFLRRKSYQFHVPPFSLRKNLKYVFL